MDNINIAFYFNNREIVSRSDLKELIKELKKNYKLNILKETIKYEKIKKANILFIPGLNDKLKDEEIEDLKKYIENSGKLIILSTEGGDNKSNSNLNTFLETYGMKFKNNSVINTNFQFQNYFHPKEVYIGNNSYDNNDFFKPLFDLETKKNGNKRLSNNIKLIYPYGCEVEVSNPSFSIFKSNIVSYPNNSTIIAGYQNENNGKIIVFGSYHFFIDKYINKENNLRAFYLLLSFLTLESFDFKKIKNVKKEKNIIPNIGELSENLKCCLQDNSKNSKDVFNLFETNLFKFDYRLVCESLNLYNDLGVKYEPWKLISPIFNTPMWGLKPAVFPPILMDLEHPKLELFDLDDEFADQNTKLAQLTNKSSNSDLSYYITECANICGLKDIINCENPNNVVIHILKEIINFKKNNN